MWENNLCLLKEIFLKFYEFIKLIHQLCWSFLSYDVGIKVGSEG